MLPQRESQDAGAFQRLPQDRQDTIVYIHYKSPPGPAQGFPPGFSAEKEKSIEFIQKNRSKISTCHKNVFRPHFPLEKNGRFRYNIPWCQPGSLSGPALYFVPGFTTLPFLNLYLVFL